MDRYEAALAQRLAEREAAERVQAPLRDKVPDRYTESVVRYYQSLESPAGVSLTLDIRFAYAPPAWAWALGGVAILLLALAVYRSARATRCLRRDGRCSSRSASSRSWSWR